MKCIDSLSDCNNMNTTALKVFDAHRLNMYLAGLIVLFPMGMISFVLNKKLVFKG